MLELKNISKIYNQNKKIEVSALKNINIKFPTTGIVFLIGKSGSGKSTLLNIIGCLDKQTTGEILVDGNNISKLKRKKLDAYLNSYVGFIFQDYNLIDEYNVYQNIDLALCLQHKNKRKEKIAKILEIVGMTGLENRKTNELSGGQKQRVAIARALSKDSKIILADEPTGNLDTQTSQQIMTLLKEISKDKLVIVVTHDIQLANMYADRIIEIQDGTIINDTAPYLGEIPTKELKIQKKHLSFFKTLQLSFRNLKTKKARMLITTFLTTISITLLGFTYMLTSFNIPHTHAKSIVSNKENKIELYKKINGKIYTIDSMIGTYTSKDLNNLQTNFNKYNIKLSKVSTIMENDQLLNINLNLEKKYEDDYIEYAYYSLYTENTLFKELTGKENYKIIGRLPEKANEILITKLYADYIIKFNLVNYEYNSKNEKVPIYLTFNSYDEILTKNYEINFGTNNLKIVGIIDEDLTKFESLKTLKLEQAYAEKNKLFKEFQNKYQNNIPIYVDKEFFNLKFEQNKEIYSSFYSYNLLKDTEKIYLKNTLFKKLDGQKEIYNGSLNQKITTLNNNEIIINDMFLSSLDQSYKPYDYISEKKKEYDMQIKEREEKIKYQQEQLLKNPNLIFEEIPEIPSLNFNQLYNEYTIDYIKRNNIIGKEITIQINDLYNRLGSEDIASYNVKIVGFSLPSETNNDAIYCYLSNNIIDKYVRENNNIVYTYFYENNEETLEKIFTEFKDKNYEIKTVYSDSMTDLNKIVKKISKISKYLSVIFFSFSTILLMNFVITTINKNKKTIGILRALGTPKKSIYKIFILESFIVSLVSSLLSIFLILSLKNYCNILISKDLFFTAEVLIFNINIIYLILLTVFITVFISSFIPLYKFSTLKPIDAIYNRK